MLTESPAPETVRAAVRSSPRESDIALETWTLTREHTASTSIGRDYLVEQASTFADKRARLLFRVVDSSTSGGVDNARKQLDEHDVTYSELLSRSRNYLHNEPSMYQALHTQVYHVQAQTLFRLLIKKMYQRGTRIETSENNEDEFVQADAFAKEIKHAARKFSPFLLNHLPEADVKASFEQRLERTLTEAFREGIQERLLRNLEAERRAHIAYRSLGGLFSLKIISRLTSFNEISDLFFGVAKEDIEITANYLQRHYGIDFHKVCEERFGKSKRAALDALLSGSPEKQLGLKLANILTERFSGKKSKGLRVRGLVAGLTQEQITVVEEECKKILSIDKKLDYEALVESKLTHHDAVLLDAVRFAFTSKRIKTELDIMLEEKPQKRKDSRLFFKELDDTELDMLCAEYGGRHSLQAQLEASMPAGPARDYCVARLQRDNERITAAEVACAIAYKEDWIAMPFLNKSKEQRSENIELYNTYYGKGRENAFYIDIEAACDRDDFGMIRLIPGLRNICRHLSFPCTHSYPFVKSIIDSGDLSVAETFRYFMEGIGVDSHGIISLLTTLTPEEFKAACVDYKERYTGGKLIDGFSRIPVLGLLVLSGDLKRDILAEVSGDLHHDIKRRFESDPHDIDSLYRQLHERAKQEYGGAFFRRFQLDNLFAHRNIRELIDNRLEELDEVYAKIKDNPEREALTARFHYLARSLEAVCDSYRLTRIALGEKFTDLGSAAAAAFGTLPALFIFKLSPLQVVPIAITTCLMGRWFIQSSIVGLHGFGHQQRIVQSLKAIGEGSAMMTARISLQVGKLISKSVSKFFLKAGVKSFFQKTITSCQEKILKQKKAQFFFPVRDHFSLCDSATGLFIEDEMRHTGIVDAFATHELNSGLEEAFKVALFSMYIKPGRILRRV